jgi:hypothetical protein
VVKRLQRASKVKEELRVVSMIDDTGMQSVSESCFWPLPAGQSPSDAEAQSSSRFVPVENVQSADSTSTDVMTSLVPLLVRGRTQLLHINNNDDDCAENTPRSRKDLNFEEVEILARELVTGVLPAPQIRQGELAARRCLTTQISPIVLTAVMVSGHLLFTFRHEGRSFWEDGQRAWARG